MNTAPTIDTGRRELAGRVSGGLEITLYWNPADDGISVEVYEASIDETITILVAPDRALEAFRHSFAYLASDYDIVGVLMRLPWRALLRLARRHPAIPLTVLENLGS